MNDIILESRGLCKVFKDAGAPVEVFKNLDLQIRKGECVAIVGRSGSGKSTLLQLLGGLELPTTGSVLLKGKDYRKIKEKKRSRERNESLGFIYQFHHLLPEFTALENVCMPLLLGSLSLREAQQRAKLLLHKVGLASRVMHKVTQLSGGERQRVAICRALVTQPDCVLGDEPTGNLDGQTADQVFDSMLELNRELNTSLIIVTHDESLAQRMDKVLHLQEGKLEIVDR